MGKKAQKRPKIGPHSIQKVCSGNSSIFALRFSNVLNSDLFKSCNSETVHGGKPEKSSLTPWPYYQKQIKDPPPLFGSFWEFNDPDLKIGASATEHT